MDLLPDEILVYIFEYLNMPNSARASAVCKKWHQIATASRSDINALWQKNQLLSISLKKNHRSLVCAIIENMTSLYIGDPIVNISDTEIKLSYYARAQLAGMNSIVNAVLLRIFVPFKETTYIELGNERMNTQTKLIRYELDALIVEHIVNEIRFRFSRALERETVRDLQNAIVELMPKIMSLAEIVAVRI